MKTLYLDPFSGVSGNMLLGSLFDLGLNFKQFKHELEKLNLKGYHLSLEKTTQSAIVGSLFEVTLVGEYAGHHVDEGEVQYTGKIAHHHGRNLAEITKIIQTSKLKQSIKESSLKVFKEIAKAEAIVHGKTLEEIHFHEVGAIDSIIDIVGFFIGIDLLGITQITSGILVDGTGTIEAAHGTMPVPVPAVMQMRIDSEVPFRQRSDVATELVTPTGFAIVKTAVNQYGTLPAELLTEKIGYGFGTRVTGHLNALRVLLLESKLTQKETSAENDQVIEMHANIDDQTGEQLGFVLERLVDAGVYDAFFTPIFTKKNRPAYQLTVLSSPELTDKVSNLLLKDTSTFGIRWTSMQRKVMQRNFTEVTTKLGKIQLKIGHLNEIKKVTVEYDQAAQIAIKTGMSVSEVMQLALQAYYKKINEVE